MLYITIKPRGVRWAGHTAHMRGVRNTKFLLEDLKKERDDVDVFW
jgi:hypothetical protein